MTSESSRRWRRTVKKPPECHSQPTQSLYHATCIGLLHDHTAYFVCALHDDCYPPFNTSRGCACIYNLLDTAWSDRPRRMDSPRQVPNRRSVQAFSTGLAFCVAFGGYLCARCCEGLPLPLAPTLLYNKRELTTYGLKRHWSCQVQHRCSHMSHLEMASLMAVSSFEVGLMSYHTYVADSIMPHIPDI